MDDLHHSDRSLFAVWRWPLLALVVVGFSTFCMALMLWVMLFAPRAYLWANRKVPVPLPPAAAPATVPPPVTATPQPSVPGKR